MAEAVLINSVTRELEKLLETNELLEHYKEVEMRCDVVLLRQGFTT